MSKTTHITLTSLLLFLISAAVFGQAASEKISKISINHGGKKRIYYLYVPQILLSKSTPSPLLILLHGSGRNGLSLLEKWLDLADSEGIILAAPDAIDSARWSMEVDGPDFLRTLTESLKSKYAVDQHRVYLFGHSAGAVFALEMGMLEAEYFAAAALHAGAWQGQEGYKMASFATRKIPIAIFIGTIDQSFSLNDARTTRDVMKARGIPVTLTEIPGHDHWYYDIAPQINKYAWSFLRDMVLSGDQKFLEYSTPAEVNDVNRLINEINSLIVRANVLQSGLNAKENELRNNDIERNREAIRKLAQQVEELGNECVAVWMETAGKVERAKSIRVDTRHRQYLLLLATYCQKNVELMKITIMYAQILESDGPAGEVMTRSDEMRKRYDLLNNEVIDLNLELRKLMG
jgi:predicted esterase